MSTKLQPTQAELQILQVLWQKGAVTVREVHEVLSADHATGYTTVLKIMQIMYEKGLLTRDESARAHVYEACVGRAETQGQLVKDMISKVFQGSASQLVVSALHGRTSKEEIAEIREILNQLEHNK
ncbi:BlaI/MecI/CopY family transcriptional regulator [Aliikangiella coralliicola]|uniref:BlaI/MecI/CopY family transcriptional regulator n=1 Tax=Aliikangiella coralliicola TaxID=2592383 RepID=A0A545U4T5_9GAMM|nr:BlaI/MecI/CopY family transcriptional regulator [Aliikangiella coralliicola]TQV84478.1 BlaI/MecI/CopY family transcriptional regulator [Aliikangiella coralliicola]